MPSGNFVGGVISGRSVRGHADDEGSVNDANNAIDLRDVDPACGFRITHSFSGDFVTPLGVNQASIMGFPGDSQHYLRWAQNETCANANAIIVVSDVVTEPLQ